MSYKFDNPSTDATLPYNITAGYNNYLISGIFGVIGLKLKKGCSIAL